MSNIIFAAAKVNPCAEKFEFVYKRIMERDKQFPCKSP